MGARKLHTIADRASLHLTMSPEAILARYGMPSYLLGSSKKTEKSIRRGVLTRVQYFVPGLHCGSSIEACRDGCLGHTSGRMRLPTSTLARDKRSALYLAEPGAYKAILTGELHELTVEAKRLRQEPACRPNGTSDEPWERFHAWMFSEFPGVQFYDYTKVYPRMRDFLGTSARSRSQAFPDNYHLTYSVGSGAREEKRALAILGEGGTVAVVFWPKLPDVWCGYRVINGDLDDVRYKDAPGSVVGLLAKGKEARADRSGFVRLA